MILEIRFPKSSKCLVHEGDKVDFNTPFIEGKSESQIKINVSQKLGIEPDTIFRYLKKLVGEEVEKGQTLALKKGFLGNTKIVSEFSGIIREVDHNSGEMVMTAYKGQSNSINCYFKGKVKKIEEHEVRLEVEKTEPFSLKSGHLEFGGESYFFKEDENSLIGSLDNKILIGNSIPSFYQIKAEALGVSGFLTLEKLKEATDLPFAQLKNIADMEKIIKLNFPYCITDKVNSKIIFYK
ncbi:MAG: hypothetical protein UR68_C0029G0006 [Candidatus Roizmanbacteria bacterium GW2011_GWA2_35_19]|uniref:Uncharacterized protein n=2 Tax=Candidatus Roizmaniibacteriota TaxID=1752723 RepID=A0A0G0BQH5_9BACT|nr:MAG: hypothetical protein UR63_C0030G0010 [Candidatus Roizmanbacteria bacterium GW2011_GWC2_35_12]KKP71638.1 MAG: hypothetical protein UR68_C0029G0006 [Candidatus Roizmanbacteria bacterium GW2011_GWA2_35_19]